MTATGSAVFLIRWYSGTPERFAVQRVAVRSTGMLVLAPDKQAEQPSYLTQFCCSSLACRSAHAVGVYSLLLALVA